MYYACLEFKPDRCIKGESRIIKKAFETREEAREYIAKEFDSDLHTSCWTE